MIYFWICFKHFVPSSLNLRFLLKCFMIFKHFGGGLELTQNPFFLLCKNSYIMALYTLLPGLVFDRCFVTYLNIYIYTTFIVQSLAPSLCTCHIVWRLEVYRISYGFDSVYFDTYMIHLLWLYIYVYFTCALCMKPIIYIYACIHMFKYIQLLIMYIWVFPKIGIPQNGVVYNWRPYWNGGFGGTPIFGNTHMDIFA